MPFMHLIELTFSVTAPDRLARFDYFSLYSIMGTENVLRSMSMKNRGRSTAILIGGGLVLLLLLIFMGVPLVNGVVLAFSDLNYRESASIWSGKNVGFDNFSAIFRNKEFIDALVNTLRMNIIYIPMLMITAVLLAASLIRVDKKLQRFFVLFFLVPAFIPGMVTSHMASLLLSGTPISDHPVQSAVIYAVIMTVKTVGIPLLFILESWQQENGEIPWHGLKGWAAPAVFTLIQLTALLTTDPDVLNNMLGFSTGTSLLDFIRTGGTRSIGTSQAAWLIQVSVQLILGAAAYFLLKAIYGSRKIWAHTYKKPERSPLALILPVLYTLFLVWFLYRPLLVTGTGGMITGLSQLPDQYYSVLLKHTGLFVLVSLAGVPISVLLARCSIEDGFFGRLTKALLILFLLTGNIGMHQFLFYNGLGLLNTWYGYIAYAFFPVMNSLVLAFILRQQRTETTGAEIWKPAFALGLLHFIFMWNSSYIPGMFSTSREGYSPARFIESMAQVQLIQTDVEHTGELDPLRLIMGFDLLLALVPVILFLIFRRFLMNSVLLAYARVKG